MMKYEGVSGVKFGLTTGHTKMITLATFENGLQ
jgi:hypothetical protein